MYTTLGQPTYDIFSPPDYHQRMISDPTQVPLFIYPYGGGGQSAYGPYPGAYFGARTMTYAEADRMARQRQKALEHRAEVSDDPSHKYLTAQGRLRPRTAAALQAAKVTQRKKPVDPVKKLQKRIFITILLGTALSLLLR